ncbi:MAG: ribosome hibernation-promoting factor, HPF/YfiA family [Candidatus Limnocylindrales bacterium]
MRTIVKGKNFDVPEDDRRYVERKMERLGRLLDDRSDAVVELSLERHRSIEDNHVVEVTLLIDGRPLRGVAQGTNHRAAVDNVIDRLERRAVEHTKKPRRRLQPIQESPLLRSIADGTADADRPQPVVVKIKRFAIEPMFEEDAVSRMEELGHNFFVFVNAEDERIAVLYRRRDGDYGLIEPSVGGDYSPGGNGRR